MISIRALQKSFRAQQGRVDALRSINLEVAEGEFCVLLGPSGCGKTTTLRCVAGLERPDVGEIEIAGKLVNSPARRVYVPTERRDLGMVFNVGPFDEPSKILDRRCRHERVAAAVSCRRSRSSARSIRPGCRLAA